MFRTFLFWHKKNKFQVVGEAGHKFTELLNYAAAKKQPAAQNLQLLGNFKS